MRTTLSLRRTVMIVMAVLIQFSGYSRQQQDYPPLLSSLLKSLREGIEYMRSEPADRVHMMREYDFIVVGAGSAGCVIANRLTEISEWKVLLIEAGQDENFVMDVPIIANMLQFSDANWKYKTVPSTEYCLGMQNNQCNFPRGKVMGGSSVLNYMIYTRGNWRDYDNWAKLGNEGWDYENVLKYFKKMEDMRIPYLAKDRKYHNRGGYLTINEIPYHTKGAIAFVNGGKELGYPIVDINGATQCGFSYHQVTMRNGTRCSTSRAYLHPIRDRKNLHVKKNSMVTKILIDPMTKLAYGVEYVRRGKKHRVFVRKEIIVSAGAINSPQLLMLSGIGPSDHLQQKNIQVLQNSPVGQNLMDHVALGGLTFLVNDTISIKTERILDDAMALDDFLSKHLGPITIPGGSEALAFYDLSNPRNPDGYPDLELLFNAGGITSDQTLKKGFGLTDFTYNSVYKAVEENDGLMILPMVMRPKSKGRILLRDQNPFHYPLIYPNYFSDPADLDVLVKGVRLSQEIMKTKLMKKMGATLLDVSLPGCRKIQFDSDEYWKCAARQLPFTIYHLSGTCKMGAEQDPTAVVNPRLRVKGVRGLRVADASIMPEVPAAHTNAPTIMIGEKISDMIKEDWNMI